MYCSKCGKELDENDKQYCSSCGTKVDDDLFYNRSDSKVKHKQSEIALTSMIVGIISIMVPLLGFPLSIIAISLAKKDKESEYARVGRITGIIGLWLSLISLLIIIGYIVFLVLAYQGIIKIPGIHLAFDIF